MNEIREINLQRTLIAEARACANRPNDMLLDLARALEKLLDVNAVHTRQCEHPGNNLLNVTTLKLKCGKCGEEYDPT